MSSARYSGFAVKENKFVLHPRNAVLLVGAQMEQSLWDWDQEGGSIFCRQGGDLVHSSAVHQP